MERLPKQTSEIFNILSKGHFISGNGKANNAARLFRIIKKDDNYKILREYFQAIGFTLEYGNGYFYFSRPDENTRNIENKIAQFERYIDILDLFTSLENKLTVGSRFRVSKIAEECSVTPRLKEKLQKLSSTKDNFNDKVRSVVDTLVKESFAELEDEVDETYKILDSFNYLVEIVSQIKVTDDDASTNP